MLSLITVPLLSRFYTKGERSIMANTWTWLLHKSCLSAGLILLEMKLCRFSIPFLSSSPEEKGERVIG